jgi:capsular polysaccharide transport system permease protein
MTVFLETQLSEPPKGWFLRALATQLRVIGALMLRDMRTRFGKTQLGYFWAIAQPLIQIAFLVLIFSYINRHPPFGTSMALFFATGVLPYNLYNGMSKAFFSLLDSNEGLFGLPIVKPVDSLIARAALDTATAVLVMFITITTIIYEFDLPEPVDLRLVAAAVLGLALVGFGLGIINAVIAKAFASWPTIYSMLTRPIFFSSGIFFVPERLPAPVREVLSYLPSMQGIELFRMGIYQGYRSSVLDIGYLFKVGLVLCLIGLCAERVRGLSKA